MGYFNQFHVFKLLMRVLLAYNKFAGGFRPKLLNALQMQLAKRGHLVFSVGTRDKEFSEELSRCDHVCVLGGDGTLRDSINLARSFNVSPSFSILPSGTINLVAREREYEKNAEIMAARIASLANPVSHYTAKMNDEAFVACLSIGPDSYSVARITQKSKEKWGRLAYLFAFVQQLMDWKSVELSVEIDGETVRAEAIYVLKSKYFAGPWSLCRQADITLPQFSVILLPKARRRDFIRLIASAIISPRFQSAKWTQLTCNDLHISALAGTPVQADGDIAGTLPMRVQIAPEPLRFTS